MNTGLTHRALVAWAAFVVGQFAVAGFTPAQTAEPSISGPPAQAPTPTSPARALSIPQVVLADVTEDKQHLLRATVTLAGSPLVGVKVNFGAVRTFGVLDLGLDTTLDDGTAAVPFPEGLPGDNSGQFEAVAKTEGGEKYGAAEVHTRLGGAGIVVPTAEPFPHALWSSKPLWPLVTVIVVLLAGVWCTYAFVVSQLIRMRREEVPQ